MQLDDPFKRVLSFKKIIDETIDENIIINRSYPMLKKGNLFIFRANYRKQKNPIIYIEALLYVNPNQFPNKQMLFYQKFNDKSTQYFCGLPVLHEREDKQNSLKCVLLKYSELIKEKDKHQFHNDKQISIFFQNMTKALYYLHNFVMKKQSKNKGNKGIIHRNITPLSIIKTTNNQDIPNYYLCNFTNFIIANNAQSQRHSKCLMNNYSAPQLKDGNYSTKADIWSFGCVLYFKLCDDQLIDDIQYFINQDQFIQNKIIANKLTILNVKLGKMKGVDKKIMWYQIVKKCVTISPVERFDASQLLAFIDKIQYNFVSFQKESVQGEIQKVQELHFYCEIVRLKILNERIMQIFQLMYIHANTIHQFYLYVFILLIAQFIKRRYNRMKMHGKNIFQMQKYKQRADLLKKNIDVDKKITSIVNRVKDKITKYYNKITDIDIKLKASHIYEQICHQIIQNPLLILQSISNQWHQQLKSSKQGELISEVIFYMGFGYAQKIHGQIMSIINNSEHDLQLQSFVVFKKISAQFSKRFKNNGILKYQIFDQQLDKELREEEMKDIQNFK